MTSLHHPLDPQADYFRVRNFLREVFLLNDRLEHSWHVARLDHWRWHFIETCRMTAPFEQVTALWEDADGRLAAVLHPLSGDELRAHVHPQLRSRELERELFTFARERLPQACVPVFADDPLRQAVLADLGYTRRPGWNHHYWRDLAGPLPVAEVPPGYIIRAMGDEREHPARSWVSWRAFHADEPDSNYDGDHSWLRNLQSAPLYRRDLDIVAATPAGDIASFCTISYDDYTRSAVTVLVGTAAEHWRRGLGRAVMVEGMRRLIRLGCTRVFSTASDARADAFYHSLLTGMKVSDTWRLA